MEHELGKQGEVLRKLESARTVLLIITKLLTLCGRKRINMQSTGQRQLYTE